MKNFICLEKINKKYANKTIFLDLNFSFECGIYTLVGPNGIGKSTLLSLLAGSQQPDSGHIIINGHNLSKHPVYAKRCLSYVPDQLSFYPFAKGAEFLDFVATIKQADRQLHEQLIASYQLKPYLQTALSDMSLGTQKKFFIVAALMTQPQILLMDEPTNGVDQHSRSQLTQYLQENRNKKIIIFSSHDYNFIQQLNALTITLLPGKHTTLSLNDGQQLSINQQTIHSI